MNHPEGKRPLSSLAPGRHRFVGLVPCFLLAVFFMGCVPRSVHTERSHLGAQMIERTHQDLRPDGMITTNQLPPGVALEDGVSEDEGVAVALWNNAVFQENLSKLGLARGDLAQAGLLANPTLSMLFPLGPKQLEFVVNVPLEALWLRPRRVAIAQIDAERVADGLVQSGLDLVRDVRAGCSDLTLARDRERLAREALKLRERVLEIARSREQAGEGSALETEAAHAEALRQRDEARRLSYDVTLLRERLLLLLGWTGASTNLDLLPASSPPALESSSAELERRALAARPDVRASELGLEAAAKRAGLARAEIFALSGLIDANGSGKKGFEIGPGMQLPIPILNQNQAGRTRAQAEMERAAWNYVGTRQRVVVEVREAHTRFQQTTEAWRAFEGEVVPAFEELERRSQRAYELGELSPVAVHENTRQLLAARVRQAELAAETRRAWAELERSVGTRLRADAKPVSTKP